MHRPHPASVLSDIEAAIDALNALPAFDTAVADDCHSSAAASLDEAATLLRRAIDADALAFTHA